jgi:hypothetical protein
MNLLKSLVKYNTFKMTFLSDYGTEASVSWVHFMIVKTWRVGSIRISALAYLDVDG